MTHMPITVMVPENKRLGLTKKIIIIIIIKKGHL
jgi:hypothetical protein